MRVGLKPRLASNASSSSGFIARDIGPSSALFSVSAGGAVAEPFDSIWKVTFGLYFLNASDHRIIRLPSVSEPMLVIVPETSLVFS